MSTDFAIILEGLDNTYYIYDIYASAQDVTGNFQITFAGSWDPDNRLKISLFGSKFSRRSNQQGLPLRAAFFGVSLKSIKFYCILSLKH